MPSSIRRLAGTALVVIAACAPGIAAAAPPAAVSLTIRASDGAGHHWAAHVSCRGSLATATGFLHTRAAAACRQARRIAGFLASRPDPSRQCTEIYGGPDTARIRGRIGAVAVDRSFARSDGCAVADWSAAGPLLPRSRFGRGAVVVRR